jgi:hypothetical protein
VAALSLYTTPSHGNNGYIRPLGMDGLGGEADAGSGISSQV